MMSAAVAEVATRNSNRIQERHAADENGLCGSCLLHHGTPIQWSWCQPWQLAQAFKNECKRQQEQIMPRLPVPRVEFTRGGRVWPAET
jgi:hypothetical protein